MDLLISNRDGESIAKLLVVDTNRSFDIDHPDWNNIFSILVTVSNCSDCNAKFNHFNTLVQSLHNIVQYESNWILPILYTAHIQLFNLASDCGTATMEDAARTMNKGFSLCATDRVTAPQISRKWGVYFMANILFRAYFRLDTTHLCANVIRSIGSADCPPFEYYPMPDKVTFMYYNGILSFYNEQFKDAAVNLSFAFNNAQGMRNKRHFI
jgi:hypothetical protein